MSISLESARAILVIAGPAKRPADRAIDGRLVPQLSAATPRFRWTTAFEGARPRLMMHWS